MTTNDWPMPEHELNHEQQPRKVGVEVEFSGLTPKAIVGCVKHRFGGQITESTRYEWIVEKTELGDFEVELDATALKSLADRFELTSGDDGSLESVASDLLTRAAEQLVPWEIVCPPIAFRDLPKLGQLMDDLREAGAVGTRESIRYAFGVHYNPELPATDIDTLLEYFRAYLCLYDWLADEDHIDFTRKISSYIKHFPKDYILLVIAADYQPTMSQFIDDYIEHNPTRNRSLDLLPLLTWIDEKRVRAILTDSLIKKRPTFHYRMPNCDIDNPEWNLNHAWKSWMMVERLANNPDLLSARCEAYRDHLDSMLPSFDSEWIKSTREFLPKLGQR